MMPSNPPERQPWLLLIHQIPPKPDYFRVKIGRRLQRIGAVAVKSSVYVLPATDHCMEDFQWVLREITEGGGDASICRASFVAGLDDAEVERLFHDARAKDYGELTAEGRALLKTVPTGRRVADDRRAALERDLARLQSRCVAVAKLDFFQEPAAVLARAVLGQVAARLRPMRKGDLVAGPAVVASSGVRGRTWVTREGIFVDRMASAWLIRRFIDPEARFKFVPPLRYHPKEDELRFDMFEAEYTHEGDRCTFETLLVRFELDDPALSGLAEIVHNLDLKDGKYDREEAPGIERILAGIATAHQDDAVRLERGAAVFEDLYALLSNEAGGSSALITTDGVR